MELKTNCETCGNAEVTVIGLNFAKNENVCYISLSCNCIYKFTTKAVSIDETMTEIDTKVPEENMTIINDDEEDEAGEPQPPICKT